MNELKSIVWGLFFVLVMVAWISHGCRSRFDRFREFRDERREHREQRWDEFRDERQDGGNWWQREEGEGWFRRRRE